MAFDGNVPGPFESSGYGLSTRHAEATETDGPVMHGIKFPAQFICKSSGQWDRCAYIPDDPLCEAEWPGDEATACAARGGVPNCVFKWNSRKGRYELLDRICVINPH